MSNLAFNTSARFTARAVRVLKEKVAMLNRRAARLGCEKISLTVGEGVSKTLSFAAPHGQTVSVVTNVYDVAVSGSIPTVRGDWSVAARMNVDPQGVVTFDLVAAGVSVEDLEKETTCEHCNFARRRRCVYFLRDGAGKMIRVGSTCLESFLGCKSPAQYAWIAEAAWIAQQVEGDGAYGEDEDGWLGGGAPPQMYPTEVVLAYALRACADEGYVSRARAGHYQRATVDLVSDMLVLGQTPEVTDAEKAAVREVYAAIAGMDESEYAFNVNSVCAAQYVTPRNVGIAVSAVSVLERKRRDEARAAVVRVNEHVGSAGERLELEVILEGGKVMYNDYGETCLYRLRTVEGHSLIWWCSGGVKQSIEDAAEAGSFKVKATVKRHGEFRGVAQTTVNRVSVVA